MNKEQFISLLRSPATINLNLVKELEEITQQFPYFQNAHLLLAKQYQGHENIRYESYLRKAAAYAPDRSVLYRLIKLEPAEVIHINKDHSEQPEKKQEPSLTTPTNVPPVQSPDVSKKEVIAQPETKSEAFKVPEIPESKTINITPVIHKKIEEIEVQQTETTSEIPPVSIQTKDATSEVNEIKESKIPEIKTFTEEPVTAKKTKEKEVPQAESASKIPLTSPETIVTSNEIKESKVPEIKTVTETPVATKNSNETEDQLANIPSNVQSTLKTEKEIIVEYNELEESKVSEQKTETKDPVIVPKTLDPKLQETDAPSIIPVTDQNIKKTGTGETEIITPEDQEADMPAKVPVISKAKSETDPQEILAKRLQEISAPKSEASQTPPVQVETTQVIPALTSIPLPQELKEKTEIPVEQKIHNPAPQKENITPVFEHHSFLEWLKIKDIPILPADRHRDYFKDNLKSGVVQEGDFTDPENQIIDNFIKTEPRIVPAKSEFYSPGNMARQSAMEHEDLISETLARIYAQQGNIPKAIDAYRRLTLKLPEKSSYFAALIRELEEREID